MRATHRSMLPTDYSRHKTYRSSLPGNHATNGAAFPTRHDPVFFFELGRTPNPISIHLSCVTNVVYNVLLFQYIL
jgi:hypothetical protein